MSVIRKLLALLSPAEQSRALLILIMIVVMAVLETFSVFSIMPFLAVLAMPDIITSNPWLAMAYDKLGFASRHGFLIFLGVTVLVFLFFGNLFRMITTWAQLRFTLMRGHSISMRLLRHYLDRPYSFFLDRNTSDIRKNILSETGQVNQMFNSIMDIIARSLVIVLLVGLIFVVNPLLALGSAIVLGGAYYGIYRAIQHQLNARGRDRVQANQERYIAAAEAFGGIKDVKLMGLEREFIRRFEGPSLRVARHLAFSQVVAMAPRFALEIMAFGGIALAALLMLGASRDFAVVLPVLGLYAFAGYRLMPAIQQVFANVTKIRFLVPSLDNIYNELKQAAPAAGKAAAKKKAAAPRMTFSRAIALKGVCFKYANSSEQALNDINLEIRAKTIVGIVGPTGSGKTTLVDLVLGLLEPTQGRLTVDDAAITGENVRSWQQCLGYVPQHIYLADDSVARNIAFGFTGAAIDMDRVIQAATLANIHDFVRESLPHGYETVVGERGVRLSGGQRQRIGIARALYRNPDALIMDEATSALDNVTENLVMQAIQNLGHTKTLVIIAHRLTTVRQCDTIHLLEAGRITASGGYNELLRENAAFQAMVSAAGEGRSLESRG